MGGTSCWERWKRRVVIVFWTILYFGLAPTVITLFLPIYLFRLIISQLRKVFRPDLDKLINTRSSVLARDKWSKSPSWNLVVWLTQEGILNLDSFREDFKKDYVLREDARGQLQFPEYQQHYCKWLGFLFWRWEDNFDMKEHIRRYDGAYAKEAAEVVDKRLLVKIVKELTWKPWARDKSPWEFLQIPNYKIRGKENESKSLLIFRIHHGLGDGYYILKLLMQDICGISLDNALGKPQYVRRSWWQKLGLGFMFWIRAPYQFVEMLVAADDVNQWHLPLDKVSKPMNAALTDPISLDYLKEIKNSHGVSFSALVLAAITGGIRNLMLDRGIPVPSEMHTAVAVPMPGHPPKLRNHFIFSFIELPIGISDPVKRLKKMDKSYSYLKHSTAPLVNFAKVPLVGALPPWMMTPTCINRLSTCLVSNFPGSPEPPIFPEGIKVLDMMFNAGLGEGSVGLGFCLISYVEHITLMSQADPGILPTDDDVELLNEKILQELEMLKNLGSV